MLATAGAAEKSLGVCAFNVDTSGRASGRPPERRGGFYCRSVLPRREASSPAVAAPAEHPGPPVRRVARTPDGKNSRAGISSLPT